MVTKNTSNQDKATPATESAAVVVAAGADVEALKATLAKATEANLQQTIAIEDLQSELATSEKFTATLQGELAASAQRVTALESQVAQLTHENAELKSKLQPAPVGVVTEETDLYRTIRAVQHNGTLYPAGSLIPLTDKDADRLYEKGAVVDQDANV